MNKSVAGAPYSIKSHSQSGVEEDRSIRRLTLQNKVRHLECYDCLAPVIK